MCVLYQGELMTPSIKRIEDAAGPLSSPSSGISAEEPDWFDRIPKVELHLHLEGAIPLPALQELIRKYRGAKDTPDLESLRNRFRYRDFPHFIEVWCWKNQFLREYEDFTFAAEAFAHHLALQNIQYAETFFSPRDFKDHTLKPAEIARAIRTGLSHEPSVNVALIADLVRDYGAENAAITLSEIAEARDQGIVGIGIGGSEHRYPPELFAEIYERARLLQFHTTAHAGEAAGPGSIWGSLQYLKVDRIGHGTRALEDEALLDYLASRRIPIEMCPLSNVHLRIVPSLAAHPIREFFLRGMHVTVNTDDPLMFGNTLAEEYRLLAEQLGFTRREIRTLVENAIDASWLSPEGKSELHAGFENEQCWHETRDMA
jgi:adenosine deaminase